MAGSQRPVTELCQFPSEPKDITAAPIVSFYLVCFLFFIILEIVCYHCSPLLFSFLITYLLQILKSEQYLALKTGGNKGDTDDNLITNDVIIL